MGFAGPRTIMTRRGKPAEAPGYDVYNLKKAAELLLGLLGRNETWGGLSFAPDGPNALRVRGPANYSARLVFDPATHLPVSLTYRERRQVREPNTIRRKGTSTGRSGGAASGGSGASSSADLPEVDIVIAFRDHRNVGGFRLPHRITWTATGVDLWEYRFEEIVVNPPLTDKDFGG
jgi:hypothetical protein